MHYYSETHKVWTISQVVRLIYGVLYCPMFSTMSFQALIVQERGGLPATCYRTRLAGDLIDRAWERWVGIILARHA